ncbi:metal-sensitive transcriptional regulator [Polaromonas sp.]|jgi:DNA-binding FrmR family transcriptional regulator|uniref:metal-sensitive transcriptional regulator n=1 Tax=Polaromonas sp. TaxID=1869339 RepID=UPI002CA96642|nr:metal-sensitive transcriptional regulator [Polaromonas sp.]HQS31959.1 metal-sensitive transcriptional regulator [Polaromonas sp.]HQS91218.1 metal-sensitive transcriptional regulator [Polaromonas sp.]
MASKSVPRAATKPAPVSSYRVEHENDVINRLRRIEGQVRGLVDMIQSGRSCEDVALQMSAARKAMDKTFYRMMTCSLMEAVNKTETSSQTIADVERAAGILEKFS